VKNDITSHLLLYFSQPFADPNAKKKYTQVEFGKHVMSQARSLLLSTLFGIFLTAGLHFYKGMVIGLAIQSIMAPFNMYENKLVMAYLTGKTIDKDVFDAKTADELTNDDEVVDDAGNAVVVRVAPAGGAKEGKRTFEDVMLDTWDGGAKADLGPLMSAINKKNCNHVTKESGWTPLMILSGLNAKGCGSAIRQVLELGGNPAMTDKEGWNAMHWAGFHGSVEAAKVLRDEASSLASVKDKEGKTPLDHARAEGNDEVAKILEGIDADGNKTSEDGLRKRK
jgi:hypothetical protein